jgi:hypothetical protein
VSAPGLDRLVGLRDRAGDGRGGRLVRTALSLIALRPVLLTDWLNAPDELKCWVFEKLGVHQGIAEMCPGWCPCAVDMDPGDEDIALVAVAA